MDGTAAAAAAAAQTALASLAVAEAFWAQPFPDDAPVSAPQRPRKAAPAKPEEAKASPVLPALRIDTSASEPTADTPKEAGASPPHPLVAALAAALRSRDSAEALARLWDRGLRAAAHAAAYAVTRSGRLLVVESRRGLLTAFGGCNCPNAAPRLLNSARLEMMDEGSLVASGPYFVAASPPVFVAATAAIVQVFLFEDAVVEAFGPPPAVSKAASAARAAKASADSKAAAGGAEPAAVTSDANAEAAAHTDVRPTSLFSAERARSGGHPLAHDAPIALHRAAERVRAAGGTAADVASALRADIGGIERRVVSIARRGASRRACWRACDRTSLDALEALGVFDALAARHPAPISAAAEPTRHRRPPQPREEDGDGRWGEMRLAPSGDAPVPPGAVAMAAAYNHPSLAPLRHAAQCSWDPVLWRDAAFLQSFADVAAAVGPGRPNRAGEAAAAAAEAVETAVGTAAEAGDAQ